MRPFRSLASPLRILGFCLATFFVSEVNADQSLCESFKHGRSKIAVLSRVSPNKFLVLDSNLRGYLVPDTHFRPYRHLTAKPSLSLFGRSIYQVPVPSNIRPTGRAHAGYFTNLTNYLGILSADARHFHVVPLDSQRDMAPVTFTAELNSVKIISHALLSNFEFDQSFWVPSTMSLMPVSVQVDSGEVKFLQNNRLPPIIWPVPALIDGGFVDVVSQHETIVYGLHNVQQSVVVFWQKGTNGYHMETWVPFLEFFNCKKPPSTPSSRSTTLSGKSWSTNATTPDSDAQDELKQVIIIGFVIIAILIVFLAGCFALLLRSRRRRQMNSSMGSISSTSSMSPHGRYKKSLAVSVSPGSKVNFKVRPEFCATVTKWNKMSKTKFKMAKSTASKVTSKVIRGW